MPVTIYQYPNCSTCRKALAWLKANGVAATYRIDIVRHRRRARELERVQKLAGVPVKKLFNVSGESYRDGDYKDEARGA